VVTKIYISAVKLLKTIWSLNANKNVKENLPVVINAEKNAKLIAINSMIVIRKKDM